MSALWKIDGNKRSGFSVLEIQTEHILLNGEYDDCVSLIRKLKRGVGFNGWTPKFFLAKPVESEGLSRGSADSGMA